MFLYSDLVVIFGQDFTSMRELKLNNSITKRDTDSLNRYLAEIGKIPLLSIAEEVMLTKRIKEGDDTALQYLVRTNLRFVVSVAKNYQNRGLSLGDLVNEGNLGLIKAAKRFDHTKGFKFISFAVWWIRQAIMLALAEQTRIIRLPLNLINSITKLNRIMAEMEQQLERVPTAEEVAVEINSKQDRVTDHLKSAKKCKSLDAIINQEIGSTLLDVLASKDPGADHLIFANMDIADMSKMMSVLSNREKKVIFLYFGLGGADPVPLNEIGKNLGLSKERTRQLKDLGINKMRKAVQNNMQTNRTL